MRKIADGDTKKQKTKKRDKRDEKQLKKHFQ